MSSVKAKSSPNRSTRSFFYCSLASIIAGVFAFICAGCASKAITPPYSEALEEAGKKGIPMQSVEEGRALFHGADNENFERLVEIVDKRKKNSSGETEYKIGPGDEIELTVFDVPELNITVKVRESGYLSLPLIGGVEAQGKTDTELQAEIKKRLTSYVINPQVNVFVSDFGSQKVAVVGAVRKPGTYPLKKGVNNVLELLGEAGGVTEMAGNVINFVPTEISGAVNQTDVESRARLAVATEGRITDPTSGIEVYLDQIMGTSGGIPLEVPVRGGDMVIVPEAGKIMIEGEVEKPGAYDLGRRMSLLGGLAAAGGITYAAKIDEVEIIRDVGAGKRAHFLLDLQKLSTGEEKDVKLKTGDVIRVPSHSGKRLRQDTFEGITKIINFGVGGSVNLAQ